MRSTIALSSSMLAAACADDEDDRGPGYALGERCAGRQAWCEAEGEAVVDCVAGRWTRRSCDELCAPALASGCASEGSAATCQCEGASSGGASSPYTCADAETLLVCDDGECTPHDCAIVCAEDPAHPGSLGCVEDACACTAVGSACTAEDRPRCDGLFMVLSCEAELWTATDCRETVCPRSQDVSVCMLGGDGTAGYGCF